MKLAPSRHLLIRFTFTCAALAFGALTACHTKSEEPIVAAVDAGRVVPDAGPPLRIQSRAVDLGVYLPAAIAPAALTAAQDQARTRFPRLTVMTTPAPTHTPSVFVFAPEITEFPPPSLEQLGYLARGLDSAQATKAAASKGVVILAWKLNGDLNLSGLREAQRFTLDIAQKNGGFVWDETTRELFTTDSWQKIRIEGWDAEVPDMRHQITIHYYETDAGHHRAITLGLEKFGFPDIVVQDVAPSVAGPMSSLIDAAAQLLVEGALLGSGGELAVNLEKIHHKAVRERFLASASKDSKLGGQVTLTLAKNEKGDPDNRLLEMGFGTSQGNTESARQAAALTAIMGTHTEAKAAAIAGDAEMAAAVTRAQAKLPDIEEAFKKGLPKGEHMMVEAQFDTDDGHMEWLWIGVSSWADDGVVWGPLVNEPKGISALRRGSKVEASRGELVDYLWVGADGKTKAGGETDAILHKRATEPPTF